MRKHVGSRDDSAPWASAQANNRGHMKSGSPRRGQNTAGAVEGKLKRQIPISPSPLFQLSDAIAVPKIRNGVVEKTAQWRAQFLATCPTPGVEMGF